MSLFAQKEVCVCVMTWTENMFYYRLTLAKVPSWAQTERLSLRTMLATPRMTYITVP